MNRRMDVAWSDLHDKHYFFFVLNMIHDKHHGLTNTLNW
jgi:DMSO/TMAO reductase YedYZ heme-binding membrane subunit